MIWLPLRRPWTIRVRAIGSNRTTAQVGRYRTREQALNAIDQLDDEARAHGYEDFWTLCTPTLYEPEP